MGFEFNFLTGETKQRSKFGGQQLIFLSLVFACSLCPNVLALRCYKCTYSTTDISASNPGCEYSSPSPDYLVNFNSDTENTSRTISTTQTVSMNEEENAQDGFCSLTTIKSNETIQSIYRSGYTFQNRNEERLGFAQECVDLIANSNQNSDIQNYIQMRWKATFNKATKYYEAGDKDCKDGTMVTEIITIFGCYCNSSDGCNGAEFNFNSSDSSNAKPSTITLRTCYPRVPREMVLFRSSGPSAALSFGRKLMPEKNILYYFLGVLMAGFGWTFKYLL